MTVPSPLLIPHAVTLPLPAPAVAIVVLMRDEATVLPALIRSLAALDPPPGQVIAVDGGSSDRSVAVAAAGGLRVLRCPRRGRAAGINAGVAEVSAPIVCVLHADTLLPRTMTTSDRRIARWGALQANWIFLQIGVGRALGRHRGPAQHYEDVR